MRVIDVNYLNDPLDKKPSELPARLPRLITGKPVRRAEGSGARDPVPTNSMRSTPRIPAELDRVEAEAPTVALVSHGFAARF